MELMSELARRVHTYLVDAFGFDSTKSIAIQIAPSGMGDFAICTAQIAPHCRSGTNPVDLSRAIAQYLKGRAGVMTASAAGIYVNLVIEDDVLVQSVLTATRTKPNADSSARVLVEYLSPNTNKPLHLGHVRNGVLGSSLVRLLAYVGHQATPAILINDRGIHICKSMLAYQLFGEGQTPEQAGMKGDHFVGTWYVAFAKAVKDDPSLDVQAEAMLRAWEAGDPDVRQLWSTMNQWVYDGFKETENCYGFHFDVRLYESELYTLGRDIVHQGLERGIFTQRDDGTVIYSLDPAEFGLNADQESRFATVLRDDGTSIYLTQDIGVAVDKADRFQLDRSVYVVACEQAHHFKVLFAILRDLGYPWASHLYHLSYEMVELPHGRMKSREGTVVDADDLASETALLAYEELRKRDLCVDEGELQRRAAVIGMAAIKFFLLSFGQNKKIVFDPQKSLSFDGDTGPYILYTYARGMSILRRNKAEALHDVDSSFDYALLGDTSEERQLALQIITFPEVLLRAAALYDTAMVARAVLEIARSFNKFYAKASVLDSSGAVRLGRLALTQSSITTLKTGLTLLGISTIEEM